MVFVQVIATWKIDLGTKVAICNTLGNARESSDMFAFPNKFQSFNKTPPPFLNKILNKITARALGWVTGQQAISVASASVLLF